MNTVGSTPAIYSADEISVEREGGQFEIMGTRYSPPLPDTFATRDLVRNYQEATARVSKQKGGANNAPHVAFVRADSDASLQEFVFRYGPVCPIPSSVVLDTFHFRDRAGTRIRATEDLS